MSQIIDGSTTAVRLAGALKRRMRHAGAAVAALGLALGAVPAASAAEDPPRATAHELGARNCWPNGAPRMTAITKADTTWGTKHIQRNGSTTRDRSFLGGALPQYTEYDAGFYVVDRGAIEVIWPGVVLGAVLGCH